MGDGVLVAAQRVGGGDEPTEVEALHELEGAVEVGALVGVGTPERDLALPQRGEVDGGDAGHADGVDRAAGRRDASAWAIDSAEPTQSTTASAPPLSWPLS